MPYNIAADSFHIRNLVANFLQAKCDFRGKTAILRFWAPLGIFFSLGITAEALRAIIGSKSAISLQREPVDPKFQVEGDIPNNNFCIDS